jgi:hypothetical protein
MSLKMNSDDREKLILKVQETAQRLREYLNTQPKKRTKRSFVADPVRTKNLEKIAGYLQSILVYLDVHNSEAGRRAESLLSLLEQLKTPSALSANNSWELADLLDSELLWFSDAASLYTLLKAQQGSASDDARKRDNYFPSDYLQILINHYQEGRFADAHRLEVIHFLEYFKQAQISEYRRDRAKVQLRGIYLVRMALVLGLMLLGLCVFYIISSRQPDRLSTEYLGYLLLLMVSAGATGSVLSRAIKLGKQPLHISDAKDMSEPPLGIRALLSDWKIFLAQPVIGAATALVIFLIISSGLLQIGGMKELGPAGSALIGFLTGFSEPFFIGTLDKIAAGSGKAT